MAPEAVTHSPTHPLTHSPTHPLTHSPTHPLTHSPTHPLTHSPTHPLTHSPTHPLTHSPTHPLTHSPTHHPHHRSVNGSTSADAVATLSICSRRAHRPRFRLRSSVRATSPCTIAWTSTAASTTEAAAIAESVRSTALTRSPSGTTRRNAVSGARTKMAVRQPPPRLTAGSVWYTTSASCDATAPRNTA